MIESGNICGAEVLLRWEHPDLYKVTLEGLILRAEQSTLIDHLTEWVVDSAVARLVAWHREGMDLPLSVNVSARNLQQPEFVETVGRILRNHGVEGHSLELEVTEGALMHDPGRIIENMRALKDLGVSVAIDDFGTGYSSLQYLSMLPAAMVKIDKGFVREAPSDQKAASLVRAAVNLGHGMGLLVAAEGVETIETYRFLEEIGCDVAQGYYIGHPVSAGDFTRWFRERKGRFVPGSS
jgi:EAL domain-containing protein (putative c-di-GMP-specific phosphodiesterase class I)